MAFRRSYAVLFAGCLLAVGSTHAVAEGAYVGSGGANLMGSIDPSSNSSGLNLQQRSSIGAFGALGYQWQDGFGAEVEGGMRARNIDGGSPESNGRRAAQNTTSFMLNARLSPNFNGPLQPYAGVGAGVAVVQTDDHSLQSESDNVAPVGQALAGFSLDVSPRTRVFGEYRYFKVLADDTSKASPSNAGRDESHAAMFGLRVRLGDFPR
jgi:opacity protein-like surface antigen